MNSERYKALSRCLVIVEALQRSFSTNEAMTQPRAGFEAAWEDMREDAAVIREMLIEARYK